MRDPVTVEAIGADTYRVEVGGRTTHTVTARPEALARIARPGEPPGRTVARVFDFLLAREPAESILGRFALEDVARYFPEFWSEMA